VRGRGREDREGEQWVGGKRGGGGRAPYNCICLGMKIIISNWNRLRGTEAEKVYPMDR